MASEDKKDLATRYLPNLWHSLVQVIIQSRLGEKAYTISKSPAKGSTMFNLEINADEEISQSIKKYMGHQQITPDNPFSIEILLRTKDGDVMVLEVWTLSIDENMDSSPLKISQVITDRMSILLKSAICVSRVTPAYGLSFRQSYETFVILYRLYIGKPNHNYLGENSAHVKVGQTNIHSYYLSVNLAYRTVLTFSSEPKVLSQEQMMLRSDHFKIESSPIHHRRLYERGTDSSDTVPTSDESQDAIRLPFNSPMELHSTSPRSRTSSESSNRGRHSIISSEKIHVPFASSRPRSLDECSVSSDLPFSNLLVSAVVEKADPWQQDTQEKKGRINVADSSSMYSKPVDVPVKSEMNSSSSDQMDNNSRSFASNTPKEDTDYVVVDLKTPFVGPDGNDLELSTFYREWQSAPPLQLFSNASREDGVRASPPSLSEQLKTFENCANDYEDLVKSLHLDDQSSQELG